MTPTKVFHDERWLTVSYPDGHTEKYLDTWLRDNTRSGRHVEAGQRTFDINRMDDVHIVNSEATDAGIMLRFTNDDTDHFFDETWLRAFANSSASKRSNTETGQTFWGSDLQDRLDFIDYRDISIDDSALGDFLAQVAEFGFGLLNNVPNTPGTILEVIDLFGYVRNTNYGELFDVRVEPNPANLAFTSFEVGMHTDNPYRDPVPGLQLLHCLVNDSDGGESQLADGFAVANQMRRVQPAAFQLLLETPVDFRFYQAGVADLRHRSPLITMMDETFTEIRYNSRSVQAFDLAVGEMEAFYDAYRIFGRALHEPSARIEFRLEAGQLMIFDNQRVLHGRSAYEQGTRHLQGSYADKDSLKSKLLTIGEPK
ncbi:MAG: TauD/TfdA family dioxygenase [Acidimicrobiales bacterium]